MLEEEAVVVVGEVREVELAAVQLLLAAENCFRPHRLRTQLTEKLTLKAQVCCDPSLTPCFNT